MAKKAGGTDLYTSWIGPFEGEMGRFDQECMSEIRETMKDFSEQGFRVVRGALSPVALQAVKDDVEQTAQSADEHSQWGHMFSGRDKCGRVTKSSDRQMAKMPCEGPTFDICQEILSKYLGTGGHFELSVRALTLMDTQAENPQPDHADYGLGNANDWKIGFPVGGIVCFEEGSRFSTYVGSLDAPLEERVEIELSPGDVVIFHGGKVHRGASYPERNRRLHFYAAHARFPVPENTTFLV